MLILKRPHINILTQIMGKNKQTILYNFVFRSFYIFMSFGDYEEAQLMLSRSANNQTSFCVCVGVVNQGLQALWICFPAEGR